MVPEAFREFRQTVTFAGDDLWQQLSSDPD